MKITNEEKLNIVLNRISVPNEVDKRILNQYKLAEFLLEILSEVENNKESDRDVTLFGRKRRPMPIRQK